MRGRPGSGTVIDLRNEMERGRGDVHPVVRAEAMAGITIVHAPRGPGG